MIDMTNVIEQKISNYEKSICEKCSHRRVCRAIDNQPCFECNQFEPEIVLCKDCKKMGTTQSVLHWCNAWNNRVKEDGFCSYGERREVE